MSENEPSSKEAWIVRRNAARKERTALLHLPRKPADLDCVYTPTGWVNVEDRYVFTPPPIDCPKKLPQRAAHVGTVEWAWSPAHSRQDRLHLSTNRIRSHWILWTGYFDDNETMRWEHFPYAFCVKKGVPAKTAAVYLLLKGWKGDPDIPDEPPHYFTSEGLLSSDELNMVAEVFWRTEPEAPGPAEIRQNIRENSARLKKGPVG
jgi:hypothetical protein